MTHLGSLVKARLTHRPSIIALFSLTCCLIFPITGASAEQAASPRLKPSFPDYALIPIPNQPVQEPLGLPAASPRLNPAGLPDTEIPFSWTQVVVVHQGSAASRLIGGFDPGFQQTVITLLPVTPQTLKLGVFDGQSGALGVTILPFTAGQTETLFFQVTARDILNPTPYSLIFDIRATQSRIRNSPVMVRSPGDFVQPGQIVRYTWSQSGRGEKRPKVEALLVGSTGAAAANSITTSNITEVLAIKARPIVLGHYLMTVTPRDVRGEPPRGSTSNGTVFRCAFGSENLAPVTDGFQADNFEPATGETVTLQPIAVDPQTAQSVFDNESFDFGDGTVVSGISGAATHSYAAPGIYRVRGTVTSTLGLAATAEDNVVVGGNPISALAFKFKKSITPDEAGSGELDSDSIKVSFKGISAGAGDRVVFIYNRNRFGRMNASDAGDDFDIVIKGGAFSGPTRQAKDVSVISSANGISLDIKRAQFDRTGDPRFGRADIKGIFKNQRIAICVVPADGSTPRVQVYTGNMQIKVAGGDTSFNGFVPELSINGTATTKEPNPLKQEISFQ